MPDVTVDLTIRLRTSLSVGAGGSSGTLADKSILRDGWGRPIIPGSQVKGRVRHTAEALARSLGQHVAEQPELLDDACVIQAIFGAPGTRRAKIVFCDLPLHEPVADPRQPGRDDLYGARRGYNRPSASINRRRITAEDGRLLFQETTADGLLFRGQRAIVGNLEHEHDLALLLAALLLTSRWGGAKSRGLGWAEVEITVQWDSAPFDRDRMGELLRQWEEKHEITHY
jgi:CRISPR/Cas system CSM-associated protein Csm3 (group 7 of RAMP superfamily)